MTENNFFSLARFGRLCGKHLREGRRILLAVGALAIGYMIVCAFINFNTSYPDTPKCDWFYFCYCFLGIIVTSFAFKNYSTPQQRLSSIMTPASQFEKYLLSFLAVLPVYTIVNFICFAVGDTVSTFIMRLLLPDAPIKYFDYNYLLQAFPSKTDERWIVVGAALAYQSFFFLGGIVFHRLAFFKSLLSLWAIGTIYVIVGTGTFKIFFNPETIMNRDGFLWLENAAWILVTVLFIIALFNYFVAWLRLRDTEIINRW